MSLDRLSCVLMVITGTLIAANGVVVTVVPARLAATYGVTASDPNVIILLRHRAVMLVLLGALLVAAAFHPAWRAPALVGAGLGMGTFVLYAFSTAGTNAENLRVATIDAGLLVLLAITVLVLKSAG